MDGGVEGGVWVVPGAAGRGMCGESEELPRLEGRGCREGERGDGRR